MPDSKPTSAKIHTRAESVDIPAASNKSAELRAKAAAAKAAATVAEKKRKEQELQQNKQDRLQHAKTIIEQRKKEHAANTAAKPTISKAAPAKWKAQSVVAQAVKEGAELAQAIKPIDADRINVKAPLLNKALALRQSVGNVKAAETMKIKQAENDRGQQLKQQRLDKAKQIIEQRKAEHAANTAAKPTISKAAPAKWKSQSVVAQAVKEGAELAASIKPIDADRVNVKAPKATKAQALRESVGNVKAAETMKVKQAEAERLERNKQEELERAKEIIATRKAEHEQNKRVEPVVSEAKPLNWKAESVVAQAVKEGAELAEKIRPIRTSQPNSRRATLDNNTSRRTTTRATATKMIDVSNKLNSQAASAVSSVTPIEHKENTDMNGITHSVNGLKLTSEQGESKEQQ